MEVPSKCLNWRDLAARSPAKLASTDAHVCRTAGVKPGISPKNAQLGVNIVQGTDILWDSVCDSNQRRFRGVPPAMNDSMLDLDGLSRVAGKAVFARLGGGQLQTVFTKKRLFICSIRVTPWYFRASGRVASS